jgi:AcrR family transcriptional regulator
LVPVGGVAAGGTPVQHFGRMETLPRGRHKLAPEAVRRHQRERLIAAVVHSVHVNGFEKTTATHLASHAHVSKPDLYKSFSSKDECFVAAYEDGVARLRKQVLAAARGEPGGWAQQVGAGLRALLAFLASDPAAANLLLVEGLRVGAEAHRKFTDAMRSFVSCLREGWQASTSGAPPPEAVDEAVIGGVVSLLAHRVRAGETDRLEGFFPDIAEFVLTPYLGPDEARRIISAA